MLKEHLTQNHDLASRRLETIDHQVGWIHDIILSKRSTRILELTCGPGLYLNRLSKLGHECIGIDFSPASIRHAKETAGDEGLSCKYRLADIRDADFGDGYGLVMMIYGQFNVFRRDDAIRILSKAHAALQPGGKLLLEPQRFETVENTGKSGTSWYTCGDEGGLFSSNPHLCLQESFWDPDAQSSTQRFFVVDSESGTVTCHALTNEAYTEKQLQDALTRSGFTNIRFFPSLVGKEVSDESQSVNMAVTACK